MVTFIEDVLNAIDKKNFNLSEVTFVLPSKRAGIFLKHRLAERATSTFFSPNILSIEEFVAELSNLKTLSNSEALFRFYNIYKSVTDPEALDSFEVFSKWAQIVLQDFNEIDRFLIDDAHIFDYLKSIQELNHWSLSENQTEFITHYLSFWNKLKDYYLEFSTTLKNEGVGYQGLIYREAVNNLEAYIESNSGRHVFLGFNALNKAEEQIIQGLLQNDLADIYWDIDATFLTNEIHDAGHFLRSYKAGWPYFKKNPFQWITEHYNSEKHIEVIGCPKNIGQAKYAGHILSQLISKSNLKNTALVLGDESLLLPILHSLPSSLSAANVTMGFPLGEVPLSSLFKKLFSIHKKNTPSFYYKDLLEVLNHSMVQVLMPIEPVKTYIQANNSIYLTLADLVTLAPKYKALWHILFGDWYNNASKAIENCISLIYKIKQGLEAHHSKSQIELEYLHKFYTLFNELLNINTKYPFLNTVSALQTVFMELLNSESLDFKGEPLEGLQIMGMLESRVLDFETVIITSVNEGVLPAGKTHNSFIPFDVKVENGLPTYKEKDAVYTYHFYHLLQRAKNIYIIYNTEVDALNSGEKSRFITQLDVEGIHSIKHKIASPSIPVIGKHLKTVPKDASVIERLKIISEKGFSPSSLSNYIRNPMDFYHQKVLGISEADEVEETVAANTLGSVIHNTLEDLYKPFVGKLLTVDKLKLLKPQIKGLVKQHFKKIYKSDAIKHGKNLIIYEIAKRYVSNFIESEIAEVKAGHQIKLLAVEQKYKVQLPLKDVDFPVHLTGMVDRIDEFNGTTRIIDYKSGKVERRNLEIFDWDELTKDYDLYSKAFQVLCYAFMMHKESAIALPVEAGIISFKNLQSGFLKFAEKESSNSRSKNTSITLETLLKFENQLTALILELCHPEIAFVEKEVKK